MRPIYWGLAFTLAGICSSIILSLVANLENFATYIPNPDMLSMPYNGSLIPMPAYYIALIYIKFAMFFSLPLAISMEAYLYLKGRKVGAENLPFPEIKKRRG